MELRVVGVSIPLSDFVGIRWSGGREGEGEGEGVTQFRSLRLESEALDVSRLAEVGGSLCSREFPRIYLNPKWQ